VGRVALASDGPTDVKNDLKLGQQIGWVEGKKHREQFVEFGMELSIEVLLVTLLIVFQVSPGEFFLFQVSLIVILKRLDFLVLEFSFY